MATPLDLRNRRREAQRAVRLAVNAVNAALDEWADAVGDGRRAATELTNAALTQLHLPALPLGLLGDAPGLRPAAAAKLRAQQDASLAALAACLQRLHGAVAGLAEATASLQHLLDAEAVAPLLGEGAVFGALPLRLLGAMLAEVHTQHRSELAVKAGVVEGCQQIVGDLRAADRPDSGGTTSGGTGRQAAAAEERLRWRMQVLLTAWMLSAEVDERLVEAHLAVIAADMKGF
ncbi:hypothetical protein ABPG75_007759 [Micractinium tetrahymenae]